MKNELFCLQNQLWCSWDSLSYEFLLNGIFLYSQQAPPLTVTLSPRFPSSDSGRWCLAGLQPCRERWGEREPSRGAQLTKKGKTMHFNYEIRQGSEAAFPNQWFLGLVITQNTFFQEIEFMKKVVFKTTQGCKISSKTISIPKRLVRKFFLSCI